MSAKKTIKHGVCAKVCAWNPSIRVCECDKDCEIGEYLKNLQMHKNSY